MFQILHHKPQFPINAAYVSKSRRCQHFIAVYRVYVIVNTLSLSIGYTPRALPSWKMAIWRKKTETKQEGARFFLVITPSPCTCPPFIIIKFTIFIMQRPGKNDANFLATWYQEVMSVPTPTQTHKYARGTC